MVKKKKIFLKEILLFSILFCAPVLAGCKDKTDYKELYRREGISKLDSGDYTGAIQSFTDALSQGHGFIKKTDYDINYYLGYAYYLNGDYEKAIERYDSIIALKPKDINAYYYRALSKLHTGDRNAADEDFLVVTNSDPKNYDLCIDVYFCMVDAGYKTEADSYLKAVLENADSSMSNYDKGRICYYLEDYSNARVYLEKAKTMSEPDTVLMLGKTYEAISDYSYAASLYNSYLEEKGNNAAVYNQLGVCRIKMEDYPAAISAFSSGLSIDNGEWEQELLYNEVLAYEYSLDFDTALVKLGDYLEKYPKDVDAQREYVFLSTR